MDAKKFKETYLQWSKVVIIAVAFILNAIVMCDHFLGFDFSLFLETPVRAPSINELLYLLSFSHISLVPSTFEL